MTGVRVVPSRVTFPIWGTTALLLVTEEAALPEAERMLRAELTAIDAACSRFRPDSELVRLTESAGRAASISPLLTEILQAALRAASATNGLVDPTVGQAVIDLGYDRDYAALRGRALPEGEPLRPAPGWWRIQLDPDAGRVLVPRRILLDVGATGKAFAADRAAARIATLGCGVLVSLGGDLATGGPAPEGGWLISVGDSHRAPAGATDPVVSITSGALATSSVTQRRWRRGDRLVHHIVDPRTGDVPAPVWKTVSVAAGRCVDANAAATASIIRGRGAPRWLANRRLPARLVAHDGTVATSAGWPGDPEPAEVA